MTKQLSTKKQTALQPTLQNIFQEESGAGMEGATAESFAIPFLSVLQTNSPQLMEGSSRYIKEAKAGMFFENVRNIVFDGKQGVEFLPCAYKRSYVRWGARGEGSYKGELAPEDVVLMRARGEVVLHENRLLYPLEDGTVNSQRCDMLLDTRYHYILLLDRERGVGVPMLLALGSTQIKKSKILMSMLAGIKLKGSNDVMYTPPTFANVVKVCTVLENNDKGSWYGVRFGEIVEQIKDPALYQEARAFHQSILKGNVSPVQTEPLGEPDAEEGF